MMKFVLRTNRRNTPVFNKTLYCIAPVALALCLPLAARAQTSAAETPLPVRAVTLFSSGVAYTLREGEVNGNASVPLTFRTAQINDILKSLVLLDERGTVQPVVYGAKDPIGRALQSFAVDLTQPTDRFSLLNRLRGAKVEVKAGGTIAPGQSVPETVLTGQIIGVESVLLSPETPNHPAVTRIDLSLLTDAGLQTVNLQEVKAIRFLDAKLDKEFRDALTLLASGSDDKRRQVALNFSGQGKRRVRVGYIAEAPLWKISYRLLIGGEKPDSKEGEKPYLQGWALVENTTDDDWNNVSLSLVSGRPISFIQDLYQPLYLPRPVVPPDIIASPTPQIAEAEIENAPGIKMVQGTPSALQGFGADMADPRPSSSMAAKSMAREERGRVAGGAGGLEANGFVFDKGIRGSVAAQASGQKAGELFQYNIKTPVNLPRQQAAMIPVIAQDVEGEKVSLYNADSDPRFPLNAFRIKNNTPLHLKGGPVTIFDGGVYAGDARMEDIPPADSRLVTYAVDLAVEGERQSSGNTVENSVTIRRGVLQQSLRERTDTTYTLKNKDSKPRTVLVEQPYNGEYKLIAPAAFTERTPNFYRFAVIVPANGTEKLTVQLERPLITSVGLLDNDLNTLRFWYERKETPDAVKAALQEVIARRRKVDELRRRQQNIAAEVKQIGDDQDRIRKNMAALDKASSLYQRYVKQLDEQETRLQTLQTDATTTRTATEAAENDLRRYLESLNVGQ